MWRVAYLGLHVLNGECDAYLDAACNAARQHRVLCRHRASSGHTTRGVAKESLVGLLTRRERHEESLTHFAKTHMKQSQPNAEESASAPLSLSLSISVYRRAGGHSGSF